MLDGTLDSLVMDMEGGNRRRSQERARLRAERVKESIRKHLERKEASKHGRKHRTENSRLVEALDLPEPEQQPSSPEQQEMHKKYTNERAAADARLQFSYPNFTVPIVPVAHVNRKSISLTQCPGAGELSAAKQIALRAMAHASQSAAPSCYSSYKGNIVGTQSLAEDPQPARMLVSVKHRFIFLGLPKNRSAALEEWLICRYGAIETTAEQVQRLGTAWANFTHASVKNGPIARALTAYGSAMDKMHNLLFASAGDGMPVDEVIGLPSLAIERDIAMRDVWAGEGESRSMSGSLDGFSNFLQDASRSDIVGCRGHWWADTEHLPAGASVVGIYKHGNGPAFGGAFGGDFGGGAQESTGFVFRPGYTYDDTAAFEQHLRTRNGPSEIVRIDTAGVMPLCTRPLSPAALRTPEPKALKLMDDVMESPKVQRLVCALYWQELVCTDSIPGPCKAHAPLLLPEMRPAPDFTAYAWIGESMEGLEAEPRTVEDETARAEMLDEFDDSLDDYDLEEEAMICAMFDDANLHDESLQVGIVTVDTRAYSSPIHPGVQLWRAYAAAHNHMYINLHPGGDMMSATPAEQDWIVTTRLLETLMSEAYAGILHFMYTEVDQWMVRPLLELEQLFRDVGMYGCHGPVLAVKAIPRSNNDTSAKIETGTFMFRRSPKMRSMLLAWTNASFATPPNSSMVEDSAHEEAKVLSRQYAFVHNPDVYAKYKDVIEVLYEVPFGLPYSSTIGHLTKADVIERPMNDSKYDSSEARKVQQVLILPCVIDALRTSLDRTCSLPPSFIGGSCKMCTHELSLTMPDGTLHNFTAEQCCDETAAAIPVQKYQQLAAIFEAKEPKKIVDTLVEVYEGRAPLPAYRAQLYRMMPELASPMPDRWLVNKPIRQPLEPNLLQSLNRKWENQSQAPQSCEAAGTCDAPEGCWDQMQAVSKLPTIEENQWHDYRYCLTPGNSGSASPVNAYCASASCTELTELMMHSKADDIDGTIGIITIDSRLDHPAIDGWRMYAAHHGYVYLHMLSSATPEELAVVSDVNMLFDWHSTLSLSEVLRNEEYSHVDYFVYTELDQWMTRPTLMRLEPLFIAHGLAAKMRFMAVLEEYPCRDVRGGGEFNMGTFLFRRSEEMEALLRAWYTSHVHGGAHNASWPARQGAFSHDPRVYDTFKDGIAVMPSACPLGSPYGLALGHVLGGYIVGTFNPDVGHDLFQHLVLPCVHDSLDSNIDRICALNPTWTGGTCLKCEQQMTIKRSDGTEHNLTATQCCGETDSALPLTMFRELAGLFEAKDPMAVVSLLKDVFEGKAPVAVYAMLGLNVFPDGWQVDNEHVHALELEPELVEQMEAVQEAKNLASMAPSPPPPTPPLCDTPGCVQDQSWEGPRRLVFVAPALTADTSMLTILRHVHWQSGIPYAWGGQHAGWLQDASKRGLVCDGDGAQGIQKKLKDDPAWDGERMQGICFLDYLIKTNQTAEGMFIWHDVMGSRTNEMLHMVMPGAVWFTTVGDPWTHAMASFAIFQAPILQNTTEPLYKKDECEYDGPTYRNRLGLLCFINLFVDPVLRHCHIGDEILSSQLCSLGMTNKPKHSLITAAYTVLPTENFITPLLAALHLKWGVSKRVIERIWASISDDCARGNDLGVMPVGDIAAATKQMYLDGKYEPVKILEGIPAQAALPSPLPTPTASEENTLETALEEKMYDFASWASEAYKLHKHALLVADDLTAQYYKVMNFSDTYTVCWDKLLPVVGNLSSSSGDRNMPSPKNFNDSDRWTTFDNANHHFGHIRLDQCTVGLPNSVDKVSHIDSRAAARTDNQANALLSRWIRTARNKSPMCFNSTGYQDDMEVKHFNDALVAPEYKLSFGFESTASVAIQYMQCRFDAMPGQYNSSVLSPNGIARSKIITLPSMPDYTRVAVVKNPVDRTIEGVFSLIQHYFAALRLPPSKIALCADHWPSDLTDIRDDVTIWQYKSAWPAACRDAWTKDPISKKGMRKELQQQLTKNELVGTQRSSLLKALYTELPDGCTQLHDPYEPFVEGISPTTTWWCEQDNCTARCEVPEATMASLLGHALSDAAQQNMLGCGDWMYGSDHLWPQLMDVARPGRADAMLRYESLEVDANRLETLLAHRLGKPLPPAKDGCSIAELRSKSNPREGFAMLEPGLANSTMAQEVLSKSPDLQRRICALYYHDFVCSGYELLPACKAPMSLWLAKAVDDLLSDAPINYIGSVPTPVAHVNLVPRTMLNVSLGAKPELLRAPTPARSPTQATLLPTPFPAEDAPTPVPVPVPSPVPQNLVPKDSPIASSGAAPADVASTPAGSSEVSQLRQLLTEMTNKLAKVEEAIEHKVTDVTKWFTLSTPATPSATPATETPTPAKELPANEAPAAETPTKAESKPTKWFTLKPLTKAVDKPVVSQTATPPPPPPSFPPPPVYKASSFGRSVDV